MGTVRYEKAAVPHGVVSASADVDFERAGREKTRRDHSKDRGRGAEAAVSFALQSQCFFGFQGCDESDLAAPRELRRGDRRVYRA